MIVLPNNLKNRGEAGTNPAWLFHLLHGQKLTPVFEREIRIIHPEYFDKT